MELLGGYNVARPDNIGCETDASVFNCRFLFKVPDGMSVLVNAITFNLWTSPSVLCRGHWLELYPAGCEPDQLQVQR